MIRTIRKSLCSATCVMHCCFNSRRKLSQENSALRRWLSAGATEQKSEDGNPLGQVSDNKMESCRARDTTINNESMTAAWGEKFWHQSWKILPNHTHNLVGAYERLRSHPAGPVLGWVARVEYPVPKPYTCQAVRSGFWLRISENLSHGSPS